MNTHLHAQQTEVSQADESLLSDSALPESSPGLDQDQLVLDSLAPEHEAALSPEITTESLSLPVGSLAVPRNVRLRLNLLKFFFIYLLCLFFNLLITGQFIFSAFNLYLTIAWTLYVPIAVMGLLGALGSRHLQITPFQGMISEQVIFTIPTIARNDTLLRIEETGRFIQ